MTAEREPVCFTFTPHTAAWNVLSQNRGTRYRRVSPRTNPRETTPASHIVPERAEEPERSANSRASTSLRSDAQSNRT